MTTAIDTNVIVALWNAQDALNLSAQKALDFARKQGRLVISAPVFAELLASPGRQEGYLNEFFDDTMIEVDWVIDEPIWRAAGNAYQRYSARRSRHGGSRPRRILADFLIGAHAVERQYRLLTLDDGLYRVAFPQLDVVSA
jgi:hypothetical protein